VGKVMRKNSIIIFIISILFIQCNNSIEPNYDLDFSEMEIHYSRSGQGGKVTLNIYNNGLVNAYYSYGGDTLKSSSRFLKDSEQDKLASQFESFSTYKSHYDPLINITDQDYITIIFSYSGMCDTVSVNMPYAADLPDRLKTIIASLENIWGEMIDL